MYDTLYIKLPDYFTSSMNPDKTVTVLIARVYDINTREPIVSSLHSNLLQFNRSADDYIMTTNVLYPTPKSFQVPSTQSTYEVWLRRIDGSLIDLDPSKTRVIIEFMLNY